MPNLSLQQTTESLCPMCSFHEMSGHSCCPSEDCMSESIGSGSAYFPPNVQIHLDISSEHPECAVFLQSATQANFIGIQSVELESWLAQCKTIQIGRAQGGDIRSVIHAVQQGLRFERDITLAVLLLRLPDSMQRKSILSAAINALRASLPEQCRCLHAVHFEKGGNVTMEVLLGDWTECENTGVKPVLGEG